MQAAQVFLLIAPKMPRHGGFYFFGSNPFGIQSGRLETAV
jgi:hypothetical protein